LEKEGREGKECRWNWVICVYGAENGNRMNLGSDLVEA
jgi:hypothetical protein